MVGLVAFRRSFLRPLAAREPIRRPELFLVASALTETNVTLLAALRRLLAELDGNPDET